MSSRCKRRARVIGLLNLLPPASKRTQPLAHIRGLPLQQLLQFLLLPWAVAVVAQNALLFGQGQVAAVLDIKTLTQ